MEAVNVSASTEKQMGKNAIKVVKSLTQNEIYGTLLVSEAREKNATTELETKRNNVRIRS